MAEVKTPTLVTQLQDELTQAHRTWKFASFRLNLAKRALAAGVKPSALEGFLANAFHRPEKAISNVTAFRLNPEDAERLKASITEITEFQK
ncbi:MAG: hypothetical protein H6581_20665 [Bacteroidia bacterium]|nr:hypothetical protein [Bacteroidia bacterium]